MMMEDAHEKKLSIFIYKNKLDLNIIFSSLRKNDNIIFFDNYDVKISPNVKNSSFYFIQRLKKLDF